MVYFPVFRTVFLIEEYLFHSCCADHSTGPIQPHDLEGADELPALDNARTSRTIAPEDCLQLVAGGVALGGL